MLFETPEQVRARIGQRAMQQAPLRGGGLFAPAYQGIGQMGASLGAGLSMMNNPEVKRAQEIQQLKDTFFKDMKPDEFATKLPEFAGELAKNGFQEEALKIMGYAQKLNGGIEPITAKDIAPLSKEVTPIIKGAISKREAAQGLAMLRKGSSSTDKVAAVFKFMKALDPTSTVRETEQGQVYEAEGPAAEFAAYVNSLSGGGRLDDTIFREIVKTSKTLANSEIDSASSALEGMLGGYSGTRLDKRGYLEKQRKRLPKKFTIDGSLTPAEQRELEQLEKELGTP